MNKLQAFQDKIQAQVDREYIGGYNHVKNERQRKMDDIKKIMSPNIPKGQVRIELVEKNKELEKALFLTDELNVKFLSELGVLGDKIMENTNLVAQYDDIDMNLREIRERIIDDNGDYGLAITCFDGYDSTEEQPIVSVLNPISCIIDPNNYSGSNMRFFGVLRRVTKEWLLSAKGFELSEEDFITSEELNKIKRNEDQANNLQYIEDNEGYCDIYDHLLVYDNKKWVSTWNADRTKLLKIVEIGALSEAEMKNRTKCRWGVQLHRRKPKKGSSFGISIIDEVLRFQDVITILTNLQIKQANILAKGPDTFVDSRVQVPSGEVLMTNPGGRVISVDNKTNLDLRNGIQFLSPPPPSSFIEEMIQKVKLEAESAAYSRQAFGNSQPGTQTKAEVQTNQHNLNQIIMWVSSNYMEGQKAFWQDWYRSYCLHFSKKSKKGLSLYQKGTSLSKSLNRDDFIADGKVNVFITSKMQDSIENDKEFNKLIVLADLYLKNMKPGYTLNEFLRTFGRKSNIRDFDEAKFIPYTVDEEYAIKNLPLLNKDIEVPGPQAGEDYYTILQIYRQALPTDAAKKVINLYEDAYQEIQKTQEGVGGVSGQITNTAMNNINQIANTSVSNP